MDKTPIVNIRLATKADSVLLSAIILRNALDELPADIHPFFIDLQSPEKISERLDNGYEFHLLHQESKPVAVIGTKQHQHLSHLFVDKQVRMQGIAKKLWAHYLEHRPNTPEIKSITVMSSHFAVEMYKRFGFTQTGEPTVTKGIPHVPMLYRL